MSTFFDNPGFDNFTEFSEEPMEYDVNGTTLNSVVPPVQWTITNFTQHPPQNVDFNGTLFFPTHTHYTHHPIQDTLSPVMDNIQFEATDRPSSHWSLVPVTSRAPSVSATNGWPDAPFPVSNPSAETFARAQGPQRMDVHPSYKQDLFCVSPREFSGNTRPSSAMASNPHGFSVSNTSQYGSAMGNPYCGINYPPDTPSSPSSNPFGMQPQSWIPPVINHTVTSQADHLNPRARRSTSKSSRTPRRTSSLPVSPRSPINFPEVALVHSCQWINPDGSICGGRITKRTISEHLVTHGIHDMTSDHRIPCCWMGCKLKGQQVAMKRESIVRHIREVHLRYRRSL